MSNNEKLRKVALVGTGFVGMSFAYALINQAIVDVLYLIDRDDEKSISEAMDLNHGASFSPADTKVIAGGYEHCKEADIVVITAGAAQMPGETRLDLTSKNTKIMQEITRKIMASGFDGIILVASNPVDLMSYVVYKESKLPSSKVLGSGTTLDTSRLRYLLGERIGVNSKDINAFVIGEHGDSSFVPWSNAYIATKNLVRYLKSINQDNTNILNEIEDEVRNAAYQIIEGKKATYYGIGMVLARIVQAIFNDENSILSVSVLLEGQYNINDIYVGVPAIVNREGVRKVIELELTYDETNKLEESIAGLKDVLNKSVKPLLNEV